MLVIVLRSCLPSFVYMNLTQDATSPNKFEFKQIVKDRAAPVRAAGVVR